MNRRLIDVSHEIGEGVVTYPGLPAPLICDFLSREQAREHYAPGVEFQIGKIEMVANTGTYVDSPFHRYRDGTDLAGLPLESLVDLPTVVIRSDSPRIDASLFAGRDLQGCAVLFDTGWCRHWDTPEYLSGHPFLTGAAAEALRDAGAALVGIDSLNIDDTDDLRRPVHSTLLAAEIPIVEHLASLKEAPDEGARFFAAPVKVRGFGTFPVRAFLIDER